MYDASFTGYFQWGLATILSAAQQSISEVSGKNVSVAETVLYAQSKIATSVCSTAEKYCVGKLQQYQSTTECYNYLTQKTRFGEAYELGT